MWTNTSPKERTPEAGRHGTFKDCEAQLPYVASMGFDVVYLPPIHPIGTTFRKGKNNSPEAQPDDVGSPWAIGAADGGHKSVHPQLGSLDDFRHFLSAAGGRGPGTGRGFGAGDAGRNKRPVALPRAVFTATTAHAARSSR